MAVSVNEILSSTTMTYQDIIKINSLVNRQCKLNGKKAVKSMINLYSDKLWRELLDKASKYFDNQKFVVVYFDGILSVKESETKFDNKLIDVLNDYVFADSYFEQLKTEFELLQSENKPEEKIEEVDTERTYVRLPNDEIELLQKEKPLQFVLNVMGDLLGNYPKTTEDIISGINKIFEQTDYYQNVYHYLKANNGKSDSIADNYNIVEILEKLTGIIEESGKEYKYFMEKTCSDIPEEILSKISSYVNSCIEDLVLVTDEQKQYLISQAIENNITTYQHLQQILTLIESCDINGSQLISYVVLNKYLEANTNILEVFEMSDKTEPMQLKLSFIAGFADFFKGLSSPEEKTEVIVEKI